MGKGAHLPYMFGFLGVNGRQIYPFYSFTPTIQTWPPRCSRRLHSFRPARVKTGKGKGNGDHHIHIRSEIVAVPWQPQSWASETGRKGSGKAARIRALPVTRLTRALHTLRSENPAKGTTPTARKVGEMFRPALGKTAGFRLSEHQ